MWLKTMSVCVCATNACTYVCVCVCVCARACVFPHSDHKCSHDRGQLSIRQGSHYHLLRNDRPGYKTPQLLLRHMQHPINKETLVWAPARRAQVGFNHLKPRWCFQLIKSWRPSWSLKDFVPQFWWTIMHYNSFYNSIIFYIWMNSFL